MKKRLRKPKVGQKHRILKTISSKFRSIFDEEQALLNLEQ